MSEKIDLEKIWNLMTTNICCKCKEEHRFGTFKYYYLFHWKIKSRFFCIVCWEERMNKRGRKRFANCPSCFACPDKKECDVDFKARDKLT